MTAPLADRLRDASKDIAKNGCTRPGPRRRKSDLMLQAANKIERLTVYSRSVELHRDDLLDENRSLLAENRELRAKLIHYAAECARESWEYPENEEFPDNKAELRRKAGRADRRFHELSKQMRADADSVSTRQNPYEQYCWTHGNNAEGTTGGVYTPEECPECNNTAEPRRTLDDALKEAEIRREAYEQGLKDAQNDLRNSVQSGPRRCEGYPAPWIHAEIHLNPETGEIHSDGNHAVRDWILNKVAAATDSVQSEPRQEPPKGSPANPWTEDDLKIDTAQSGQPKCGRKHPYRGGVERCEHCDEIY